MQAKAKLFSPKPSDDWCQSAGMFSKFSGSIRICVESPQLFVHVDDSLNLQQNLI